MAASEASSVAYGFFPTWPRAKSGILANLGSWQLLYAALSSRDEVICCGDWRHHGRQSVQAEVWQQSWVVVCHQFFFKVEFLITEEVLAEIFYAHDNLCVCLFMYCVIPIKLVVSIMIGCGVGKHLTYSSKPNPYANIK